MNRASMIAIGIALWIASCVAFATPRFVKDLTPGSPDSFLYLEQHLLTTLYVGGRTYFMTKTCQLWGTDGTSDNTVLVYDFAGSIKCPFVSAQAQFRILLVRPDDASLWISDGTTASTQQLVVSGLANVRSVQPWTSKPGWALINTGANGPASEEWVTDGTAANTMRLATLDHTSNVGTAFLNRGGLVIAGGGLWFTNNPTSPAVAIGSGFTNATTNGVATDGERVFFKATDATHGSELWVSDLTNPGTHIVSDITAGPGSTTMYFDRVVNGYLYFRVGDVLWRSDGTAANTYALTVPGDVIVSSDVQAVGSEIIFSGQENDGYHLWHADSSQGVAASYTGVVSASNPFAAVANVGTQLYFATSTAPGNNLFTTAGVANDVTPVGVGPPNPSPPIQLGLATLIPGTPAGIYLPEAPGFSTIDTTVSEHTVSSDYAAGGSQMYLTASTTTTGRELYTVDLPGTAVPMCASTNLQIPDNYSRGTSDIIYVPQHFTPANLTLELRVAHTYVGDLSATLTHVESGNSKTIKLFSPAVSCSSDDLNVVFDDSAAVSLDESTCAPGSEDQAYPAGARLRPAQALATFVGEDISGTWRIKLFDNAPGDEGGLQSWCMNTNGVSDVIFKNGFESPIIN